jgi:hypothetical protein
VLPSESFKLLMILGSIITFTSVLPNPTTGHSMFWWYVTGWFYWFTSNRAMDALAGTVEMIALLCGVFLCLWLISRRVKRLSPKLVASVPFAAGLFIFLPYDPRFYFYLLSAVIIGLLVARSNILPSPTSSSTRLWLSLAAIVVFFALQNLLWKRAQDDGTSYVTASASLGAPALLYGIAWGWWLIEGNAYAQPAELT